MSNRIFRIRRFNQTTGVYDTLFPQTVAQNVLRRDDGPLLDASLHAYDTHLDGGIPHLNHTVTTGTYRHLIAHIHGKVLVDNLPLVLRLHTNLECEPTLDFNDYGPKYIVSGNGERIPGGQCAGSSIFVVWSEPLDAWVLMSSDTYDDITRVMLPVESDYAYEAEYDYQDTFIIPNFDYNVDRMQINYGQTILRPGLDYEFIPHKPDHVHLKEFSVMKGDIMYFKITKYTMIAKRGISKYDLVPTDYSVEIGEDHTTELDLPLDSIGAHSIEINYGQTILRQNLDYEFFKDGLGVRVKNFEFMKGDIVTFRITQFVESNGSMTPNNWGATGNYRYSLKVFHEEYTATKNNVTVIPVPNYNRRRDDISVIRDNHLLVWDVDYTVDALNQVVLLRDHLDAGDELYFTIIEGAMRDVPDFYVTDASGDSGQHLHLDFSYDILANHFVVLVRLRHTLETAPTAKCIDGPAEPICDCFGAPVLGGYRAGAYMWLAYNEDEHMWYSLSHSQLDITNRYPIHLIDEGEANFIGGEPVDPADPATIGEVVIHHKLNYKPSTIKVTPIEPPGMNITTNQRTSIGDIWCYADCDNLYVGNTGDATSRFHWMVSTESGTADLRGYLEERLAEIKARPGNFYTKLIAYTAPTDDITEIAVNGYRYGVDKLVVNYGQTLLREGEDYVITTTGITLTHMTLMKDDIIQFMIIIQNEDTPQSAWEATHP